MFLYVYCECLFQIRLDRLVDKWSGSIEVGITTHNPSTLDFPATMTNMRSGRTLEFAHSSTMKEGGLLTQVHLEYAHNLTTSDLFIKQCII